MRTRFLAACALALLVSCSARSDWHFFSSSYSINPAIDGDYAFEVHVNQLKQFGGNVNSPEFRHFVLERLSWHEGCDGGWRLLPCVADGSCVLRTRLSVTVFARCAKS